MNCKHVSSLISEYVDGKLTSLIRAEVESHIKDCKICAEELKTTRAVVAALGGMGGLRSPVDCWPEVQGRVDAISLARTQWWHWIARPVVFAPAAVMIAILAIFVLRPLPNHAPMKSDKVVMSEYSYYIGAHSNFQRRQTFADPDMVFIKAELQKANLVSEE